MAEATYVFLVLVLFLLPFFLALGFVFWEAKWLLVSHLCFELGHGKRNLGSKQTSKELLEFDLSRISTMLMFCLVCL